MSCLCRTSLRPRPWLPLTQLWKQDGILFAEEIEQAHCALTCPPNHQSKHKGSFADARVAIALRVDPKKVRLWCGVDWLSENAAGKTCLACSVDIQNACPTNNTVLIESYIKDIMKKLGNHNGGLLAWPYYEAGVKGVGDQAQELECNLFERYGKYPLDFSKLR